MGDIFNAGNGTVSALILPPCFIFYLASLVYEYEQDQYTNGIAMYLEKYRKDDKWWLVLLVLKFYTVTYTHKGDLYDCGEIMLSFPRIIQATSKIL